MTEQSKQRDDLLQRMSWANGTLRSAVSNVNIGDGIEGCEQVTEQGKKQAREQVFRLRQYLTDLEKLL